MNQLLIELEELIIREISAYKELIALSKKKKQAIIKNSLSDIDIIGSNEQAVINRINSFETQREDITNKIAFVQKKPKGSVRLQDIIDNSDGKTQEAFISLKTELEQIIFELSRLNSLNRTLVNTHLKYSSFCIEVVSGYLNTLNTYTHSGKANDKETSRYSLLDRTV